MLLNQDKFQSFLIFVITVNIATSQNPSYQSSNQYQSQYIIGEDGEGHRSVCKGGLFHSHGHEEIHSSTDES